jgi:HlyD family secretion protein
MKKVLASLGLLALVAFLAFSYGRSSSDSGTAEDGGALAAGAGGRAGGAAGGGFARGGRGAAGPMTVELATAARGTVMRQLVVVGNLVGDATVSVVPRAAGRLQDISVRLGDRVGRGQRIAKIEDFELQEQVKQQEAALEVSRATIRQRQADLQLAETNAERSRSLFARQLLPKQTLDDTEARYQAAVAQLDLARAQNTQSTARLEELRINLDNTVVVSPVNGFVARRAVDPGAFVSQNTPVVDVVDIGRVRLVANVVEKDLSQLRAGDDTRVEVDAFPDDTFTGRIARVAPVLDPATRTASIEIEIPNPGFQLKPGMYARVTVTTDERKDALTVPSPAVVDVGGRRGVFLAAENDTVAFRIVTVGVEEDAVTEILQGLSEGDRVVTTGAAALRDGDRVIFAGAGERRGSGASGRRGGDQAAVTGSEDGPSDGPGSDHGSAGRAPRDGALTGSTAEGTPPTSPGTSVSAVPDTGRQTGGRRGRGSN